MTERNHFKSALKASEGSTCLKTQTGAVIVKDGKVISKSWNICTPGGISYGEKPEICPRINIQTGANYELCRPLHAEVMSCLNIRKSRKPEELERFAGHLTPTQEEILQAFTPEELQLLNGAVLYLAGHYYACNACQHFAHTVGISEIKFDQQSGNSTRERYKKNNRG